MFLRMQVADKSFMGIMKRSERNYESWKKSTSRADNKLVARAPRPCRQSHGRGAHATIRRLSLRQNFDPAQHRRAFIRLQLDHHLTSRLDARIFADQRPIRRAGPGHHIQALLNASAV